MWERLLRTTTIICLILLLSSSVALAAGFVDIIVTATPEYGLATFTATYITETRVDLSWTADVSVVNVMVRVKDGNDLAEIPDEDTTPNDGLLVYYGSGTSISDTSMDFDQSPAPRYYKAWGQKADGKWYTGSKSDWEESRIMTLLAFILFAGVMSFLGIRSTYWILKILAGFSWFAVMVYWLNSPPSSVTKGSSIDTVVIGLLVVIGVAFLLMPLWYSKTINGQEVGRGFTLPFGKSPEERERMRYRPTRQERSEAYRNRVSGALKGERRK